MTPEQINIAIAEHMGWKEIETFAPESFREPEGIDPDLKLQRAIPDYCNSLDAMFKAEKTLLGGPKFFSKGGKSTYIWNLKNVCALGKNLNFDKNFYLLIHIPARQRAEAFLKTIGKWEES